MSRVRHEENVARFQRGRHAVDFPEHPGSRCLAIEQNGDVEAAFDGNLLHREGVVVAAGELSVPSAVLRRIDTIQANVER